MFNNNKKQMLKKTKNNLRPPGHHLIEVTVGLLRMNSWVLGSYVAVVSRPRR